MGRITWWATVHELVRVGRSLATEQQSLEIALVGRKCSNETTWKIPCYSSFQGFSEIPGSEPLINCVFVESCLYATHIFRG